MKIIQGLQKEDLKLLKKGPLRWLKPMLASQFRYDFFDRDWLFEPKWDGYRGLVYGQDGEVRIWSRNKIDLSDSFPELVKAFERIQHYDFIVDGEIVAIQKTGHKKISRFEALQARLGFTSSEKGIKQIPVYFYAFDLLYLGGYDLTSLPLVKRRAILKAAFAFRNPLCLNPAYKSQKTAVQKALSQDWEGVIAKYGPSGYRHGRSQEWIKIKLHQAQEFVIGGYTAPKGKRFGFGALLVGYYEGKTFRYAGKVGTGFNEAMLKSLTKLLKPLKTPQPVFADAVKEPTATWVKPKYVAELRFTEWTRDGRLRHPSFVGLRKDKSARSVVRE